MTGATTFRGFEWLKAHKGRIETRVWEAWLHKVGEMRAEFFAALDDDPVVYNETATMGVLASAATRTGLLAMAEYVCWKRGADRRFRGWGRADLWVFDSSRAISWSFEAKQIACADGVRHATLERHMARACDEADRITHWESDQAYGLLVVIAPEGECGENLHLRMKAFAQDCDSACRLGGGARTVFLFFRRA